MRKYCGCNNDLAMHGPTKMRFPTKLTSSVKQKYLLRRLRNDEHHFFSLSISSIFQAAAELLHKQRKGFLSSESRVLDCLKLKRIRMQRDRHVPFRALPTKRPYLRLNESFYLFIYYLNESLT